MVYPRQTGRQTGGKFALWFPSRHSPDTVFDAWIFQLQCFFVSVSPHFPSFVLHPSRFSIPEWKVGAKYAGEPKKQQLGSPHPDSPYVVYAASVVFCGERKKDCSQSICMRCSSFFPSLLFATLVRSQWHMVPTVRIVCIYWGLAVESIMKNLKTDPLGRYFQHPHNPVLV